MAAVVEQRASNSATDTSISAGPFASNVTSGNSVIIVISASDAALGNITDVDDNIGNTYVADYTGTEVSGNNCRVYRAHNVTNAPSTFTVTASPGGSYSIAALEVSGLNDAANTDSAQDNASTVTTLVLDSGDGLTASSGDLIVGAARVTNSPALTGGDSTTATEFTAGDWLHYVDNVAGTSIDLSWTGTQDAIIWAAVYAQSSASGGGTPGIEVFRTIPGVTH